MVKTPSRPTHCSCFLFFSTQTSILSPTHELNSRCHDYDNHHYVHRHELDDRWLTVTVDSRWVVSRRRRIERENSRQACKLHHLPSLYSLQLLSYSLLTWLVCSLSGSFWCSFTFIFNSSRTLPFFSFIFYSPLLLASFLSCCKWWMCVRRSYFLRTASMTVSVTVCVLFIHEQEETTSHT